jgi:hypothetical protein
MKTNTDLINKNHLPDTLSFKIIFVISYVVIFMAALFLVVLPASQKAWLFSGSDGGSFFKSVESGVYSFMSYLN